MKYYSISFAVLMFAVSSANAAILTTVPRQGGMLMPDITYHAATTNLTVDLTGATNVFPQLTPLLVSNPADSFSSNDPWFDILDPSRQGLAFSRRYAWNMNAMTDLMPDDHQIWIRKLASTPGLSFFDYKDSVSPKTWNPIWGTGGSTNAVFWEGMMWHFGVTAPPGTNTYAATFELFVLDTSTGQEVSGSSTGPFDLTWTDQRDGRPDLAIETSGTNAVFVGWSSNATNWSLICSDTLVSPNWLPITNASISTNSRTGVFLDAESAKRFFRLRRN